MRFGSRLPTVVAMLGLALGALPDAQAPEDLYCPNYTGRHPPELIGAVDGWINRDASISLGALRGHVVWLEFSFIACGGCQMMKAHLQGLQRRYGPEGLVVLEVNNGEIDSRDAVASEVEQQQPNYPVLWDEEGRTCEAYGVNRYGTAYLIGADGKVIWGGNPLDLSLPEMWRLVTRALRGVDIDELRENNSPLLARDLGGGEASTVPPAATAVETEPVRYTLGWDFVICTTDNSMELQGVAPSGPAERAGLREGDVVVAIDELILSQVPFEELKNKLHRLDESPSAVTVKVKRGEEFKQFVVTPVGDR